VLINDFDLIWFDLIWMHAGHINCPAALGWKGELLKINLNKHTYVTPIVYITLIYIILYYIILYYIARFTSVRYTPPLLHVLSTYNRQLTKHTYLLMVTTTYQRWNFKVVVNNSLDVCLQVIVLECCAWKITFSFWFECARVFLFNVYKMSDRRGMQILNLPQLQNLIKRDRESYKDEVSCNSYNIAHGWY